MDLVDEDAPLTEEDDLSEEELLVDDPDVRLEEDDPLLEEEDERLCEEVVLLLEPEERLSCEYESTGEASMASATADARAMFRMFFMTFGFLSG